MKKIILALCLLGTLNSFGQSWLDSQSWSGVFCDFPPGWVYNVGAEGGVVGLLLYTDNINADENAMQQFLLEYFAYWPGSGIIDDIVVTLFPLGSGGLEGYAYITIPPNTLDYEVRFMVSFQNINFEIVLAGPGVEVYDVTKHEDRVNGPQIRLSNTQVYATYNILLNNNVVASFMGNRMPYTYDVKSFGTYSITGTYNGETKAMNGVVTFAPDPNNLLQGGEINPICRFSNSSGSILVENISEASGGAIYDYEYSWEQLVNGTWVKINKYGLDCLFDVDPRNNARYILRREVTRGLEIAYSNTCFIYNDDVLSDENKIITSIYNVGSVESVIRDVSYFDGLGRPIQKISLGGSPMGNDIVSPIVYDVMGRDNAKVYLPYATDNSTGFYQTNAIADQLAFYQQPGRFPGETITYQENIFEASPLNRMSESYNVGRVFRDNNKKSTAGYCANGANEVLNLKVASNGGFEINGYHNSGTLHKNIMTTEDGLTSVEFTDVLGRTILARVTYDTNTFFDTYYVYDEKGSLCWVISPEGSASFLQTGAYPPDSSIASEFSYMYVYDGHNRLVEKRLPGTAAVYMVYDAADRPIAMQDGNLRDNGKWAITRYDPHDRIVEMAFVTASSSRAGLQDNNAAAVAGLWSSSSKVTTALYKYDGYDSADTLALSMAAVNNVVSINDRDLRMRGLKTYEKVLILNDSPSPSYVQKAYYYDYKGRVVQSVEYNHLGGISRTSLKYDFVGNVLKRHESHQYSSTAAADILLTEYVYDSRGRMTSENTTINGQGVAKVVYTYNELGQLQSKTFGDGTVKETYAYNIQGWLTDQNSSLFEMKLRYYDKQKAATPVSYTGNITEWEWQHMGANSNNAVRNTYSFSYDKTARLLDVKQYQGTSTTPVTNFVEQGFSYDKNGNIKTLQRYASGNRTDNFTYTYVGNQLTSLSNNTTSHGFSYDANGNATADGLSGTTLTHNSLNLVSSVKSGNTVKANYRWLADGTKAGVTDGAGSNGFEYLGSLVYKRTNGALALEGAAFGEGRILKTSNTYTPHYFIRDHLGSTRVVATNSSTVSSRHDYYPFGMAWDNPGMQVGDNRYLYNGKEKQVTGEVNYLDYGARMYDARLGRWFNIDPLAQNYYLYSPYVYANNNPIRFIDVLGLYFDEAAEKYAKKLDKLLNKQIQKVEKSIARDEKKGRDSGDKQERVNEMRQSREDLSDMRNDNSIQYSFANASSRNNPAGKDNPTIVQTGANEDGHPIVTMFGKSTGSFIHESRHGGQIARGEYSFDSSGQPTGGYTLDSEVSAYRAQYAYDGIFRYQDAENAINIQAVINGIAPPIWSQITNINSITPSFVGSKIGEVKAIRQLGGAKRFRPLYESLRK